MEKLKFIHCADLHLDAPFKEHGTLEYAQTRRQDIKNTLKRILEKVRETGADFLLISGDLYEHQYITRKTMDWLYMVLSQVDVPVFIIPGNHDPYLLNSWYNAWEWPKNVHILSSDKPHLVLSDLNLSVYGEGFSSFKEGKPDLSQVVGPVEGYFNILMLHGTLDMDFSQQDYKPITTNELVSLNYDYYALGHFHTTKVLYNIINPGSPEPLGFDEQGKHGVFLVTLIRRRDDVKIESQFLETAQREYHEKILDVSSCNTLKEVKIRMLESVEGLDYKRDLIRMTLKGRTDLSLDVEELSGLFSDWLYFSIRNESQKAFNVESLMKNPSLKGAFVREVLGRIEDTKKKLKNDSENEVLKSEIEELNIALSFGLEALESGKIEWWEDL